MTDDELLTLANNELGQPSEWAVVHIDHTRIVTAEIWDSYIKACYARQHYPVNDDNDDSDDDFAHTTIAHVHHTYTYEEPA